MYLHNEASRCLVEGDFLVCCWLFCSCWLFGVVCAFLATGDIVLLLVWEWSVGLYLVAEVLCHCCGVLKNMLWVLLIVGGFLETCSLRMAHFSAVCTYERSGKLFRIIITVGTRIITRFKGCSGRGTTTWGKST